MKRIIQLLLLTVFAFAPILGHAQAGKKKTEEKPPVYNYVIDDPMDKFQPAPDSVRIVTYNFLVPDFYYHTPKMVKDTTYEFFCYDKRDTLIPNVYDYDSVYYYSLYKSYTDYQHTYIDKDGKKQFIPVSSIAKRYDRVGREKWMTIEYPGNKYGELRAIKNIIVGHDTENVKGENGTYKYQSVYHRYKLLK